MQVRVDWVLRIFGTQVIKKKRPVRPVFPDYLSVSYDYVQIESGLENVHNEEERRHNMVIEVNIVLNKAFKI